MSKNKGEQYVPFDKMSKKKRREYNAQKRNDWGEINPITKREEKNAYKRKKQKEKENSQWYD